ncbi:hypothetical protein RLW55_01355 [Hyphomicrobium sp. B1]|uniref:hypothetical protein n=1 Tax=unclassified Hyphomicrobium TaxID=2619925 RepID=UPI00391C6433
MHGAELTLKRAAEKILRVFAYAQKHPTPFHRYWALVGPVASFSEVATGVIEQELAKAMQDALEEALRKTAPRSWHPDAEAVEAAIAKMRSKR